jgi:hypothetical protein
MQPRSTSAGRGSAAELGTQVVAEREVEFVDAPDECQAGLIAAGLPGFIAERLITVFGSSGRASRSR